ncbi:hypothetical protein HDF26_000936 [Pedobacter cryoconitis]|uniref:Uncharacterized protein n=1 Tax=Pedobacter cryoconitis TaxID=188932 RepID=A0A7W9E0W3_9SPHI|nr:hypothetical protein [Pedobacter cryoconitis]MBB5637734.1 hypothetical protein [Pedobacter cryoconitis]MBB6270509.1 hypothetical protein [Pedobacter cryoconitis]
MADLKTEFSVEFEGEEIPVIITEVENDEDSIFMVDIPGHENFEIFLSEDDMWVTNDEVTVDEDFIFLIGDKFESLQP